MPRLKKQQALSQTPTEQTKLYTHNPILHVVGIDPGPTSCAVASLLYYEKGIGWSLNGVETITSDKHTLALYQTLFMHELEPEYVVEIPGFVTGPSSQPVLATMRVAAWLEAWGCDARTANWWRKELELTKRVKVTSGHRAGKNVTMDAKVKALVRKQVGGIIFNLTTHHYDAIGLALAYGSELQRKLEEGDR